MINEMNMNELNEISGGRRRCKMTAEDMKLILAIDRSHRNSEEKKHYEKNYGDLASGAVPHRGPCPSPLDR